ncbi:MAG: endonuclease [Planctomycetota bacterium]
MTATAMLTLVLLACSPSTATDDPYADIPVEATGDALKAQLHDLVDDHESLDYSDLWDALAKTDADPDKDGHVILFYTGNSRNAEKHGSRTGEWNREHIWAKSRGGFRNEGPGADLHMIRPTDVRTNSARGNLSFDDGGEPWEDSGCKRDRNSWEPRDAVKGDVARAIFYAATRYEQPDLELIDEVMKQDDRRPRHGKLSTLLRWHKEDPPDDAERLRNDRVEKLQGNRNPFVDRPEFAGRVWGTSR